MFDASRITLQPSSTALRYIKAYESLEQNALFLTFGKAVLVVLVSAIEAHDVEPTRDEMFQAIITQGRYIGDDLDNEILIPLQTIRQHPGQHYEVMVSSLISLFADPYITIDHVQDRAT